MLFLKDKFNIRDGSQKPEKSDYDAEDYVNFISNGMADNEKINAVDYFENFLTENTADDE